MVDIESSNIAIGFHVRTEDQEQLCQAGRPVIEALKHKTCETFVSAPMIFEGNSLPPLSV